MTQLHASGTKLDTYGGSRVMLPRETWKQIEPWLGDFGITRVADITRLDRIGIPVWTAVRPNSRTLAVTQGKGVDEWAARVSATMEAIELAHAEEPSVKLEFSTYRQLRKRAEVVDILALPSIRNSLFADDRSVFWTEAVDLISGRCVWVPYEMVYADATVPWMPGSGAFLASTNGLASGNVRPEAILHGLCEVVERDAMALWEHTSRDGQACSRLDLSSVRVPTIADLLGKFSAANIVPIVWNVTSDVGIPVFRVVIFDETADPDFRRLPSAFGAGCHPNRTVALCRALTEAAQSRLTVIAGSRDDFGRGRYRATQSAAALDYYRALAGSEPGSAQFEQVPDFVADTVDHDVAHAVGSLRGIGIDRILVVDLSRPHYPVSVVRVIVPGLEGPTEAASYAPGRRARAIRHGAR